ncbi:hypothetical protein OIU78_024994 [Salix suchowensis]|nr:hypothetical protein OIU78_024994 [Salix suchowensis]
MAVTDAQNPLLGETTCGTLLQKLQEIWDEVGESDEERDKMLIQIEQECLDVYKKKVEQAVKSRAQLLEALSDARTELACLLSALGEKCFAEFPEKASGTIKEQLEAIAPVLEQLWEQKTERVKEFSDVQTQIQKICGEIAGNLNISDIPAVDDADLSLQKLNEYHAQLQELQKEKSDRLHKVLEFVSSVHDLCAVLGMDFFSSVTDVHPSLNDLTGMQSISNDTLARLAKTVLALKEEKKQRLHKLQELANQLMDLWNLMDTPMEERKLFDHVTCNMLASVDEVTVPRALALDLIEQAEAEVERLDQLKTSRMKEIAFKKQAELEEIYAHVHVEIAPDGNTEVALSTSFSSLFELFYVDAMESASRDLIGFVGHVALVDTLVSKTRAWEEDRGIQFAYDGVPLLAMLDEYAMLRQEREEEKQRMRDQKKFHEQQSTEQEPIFGSRSSPARQVGTKKAAGSRANGGANGTPSRRLSLNTHQNGSRSTTKDGRRDSRLSAPVNYVSMSKDDATSHVSGADTVPASP